MSAPASSSSRPLPENFKAPAFRSRRNRNWIVLGLLYALFYMTRYNFAANMDGLARTFGWTNSELGRFEFWLPMIYGISVVLNGPISDRIGGKKAFLIGGVGVTIMSLLYGGALMLVRVPAIVTGQGHDMHVTTPAQIGMGLSSASLLNILVVIWAVNAYFQSFGALSIVKVNAQWFHVSERGVFSGIFGVLIRFGLILAFSGTPLLAANLGLAYAFILPGLLTGVMVVLNYFFMENAPPDAGFDGLDTGDGVAGEDEQPPGLRVVFAKIFANPSAWTIAFASMMLGLVRRSTIDSWWGKYFSETHVAAGVDKSGLASYQAASWGIALLGIAGGFVFGALSDKRFQNRRAPVVAIGFVGMTVMLVVFGITNETMSSAWQTALCLSMLSFFVNGAHGMIGGAASMDFGGRKAAATAAGLFDGMQYLASAFIGPGMGMVLDSQYKWHAWPWVPIPFAIIGAILISRLWNVVPGQKKAPAPAASPDPKLAAS